MCYNETTKHWILYVFDVKNSKLEIYDPLHANGGNPNIYKSYTEKVEWFLSACKTPATPPVVFHTGIPEQTDGWRCGYYLMMNMICIVQRNFNFNYNIKHIENLRLSLQKQLERLARQKKASTNKAYRIVNAILKAKNSKRSKK